MGTNTQDLFEKLQNGSPMNKYYVYRLIDPRNLQTFYIGKGCGDRVYQHAKEASKLKFEKDQTIFTEKINLINEITSEGKEVICVIHRWGMPEKTAFEVEAALIDAYPGLSNKISGHHSERGIIPAEDLLKTLNAIEYNDNKIPAEYKYLIIKTSFSAIIANGSLYEATRRAWKRSLRSVRQYKYVLSVINGIVKEVYEVEKNEWYNSPVEKDRIEFDNKGRIANDQIWRELIGKKIPSCYRKKGMSNPVIARKLTQK